MRIHLPRVRVTNELEDELSVYLECSSGRHCAKASKSSRPDICVQKPPGMPVEDIAGVCAELQPAVLVPQGKILGERKVLVSDTATSALGVNQRVPQTESGGIRVGGGVQVN